MQNAELSILIPAKNIEKEVPGILEFAAKQAAGLDVEFILVDMGSSDKTVLQAVTAIKELGLRGFVIQNGSSNVPSALNTAVQKAQGLYLSFLFARRLYRGFLPSYLETAQRLKADVVFGCSSKEETRMAELRNISSSIHRPNGASYAKEIIRHKLQIDIAAVLVRREFLLSRLIAFDEACPFGYAEEFLLKCLVSSEVTAQAPVSLRRSTDFELKRGKSGEVGFAVFSRVKALLNIRSFLRTSSSDVELLHLLEKDFLPCTVMNCIDVTLREGIDRHTIREFLHSSGYGRLLTTDRKSSPALRKRIFRWKTFPGLYRA